jgi:hypothetical protein
MSENNNIENIESPSNIEKDVEEVETTNPKNNNYH